jgi:hypothetical protein
MAANTPAPFKIVPATTRAAMRDFHRVPYRVYQGDPNWVPPLLLERHAHFTPSLNPFFRHASARFWVAYRDGEPAGRITAQIDRLHLERHNDASGHFGFLEALDDSELFVRLLTTAEEWLRSNGIKRALGPVSFAMWDQAGLLIDGFDTPPYFMMGHARPYFQSHIQAAGYRAVQDLLAYEYSRYTLLPPTAIRAIRRARESPDVEIRPIRKARKQIDREIAILMDVINDAWSDNWGFVPITAAEMHDIRLMVCLALRSGDVAIAEYKGEPVAFALVMPDFNEAIRDLGGRLFPFGWAKALWRLNVAGTRRTRMPFMGVRKKLQSTPLGAALALAVISAVREFNIEHGAHYGELSWVLDQNEPVKHIISLVGARKHKRYRIYEKQIA